MSKINEDAATWAGKRAVRELDEEELGQFNSWLRDDIRHLGAYVRAEAILIRVERAYTCPLREEASRYVERGIGRRSALIAASALSLVGIVSLFWDWPALVGHHEEVFSTGLGQFREFVLADGSVISLNTNSEVGVNYSHRLRQLTLRRGEAIFDVAKNHERPFIVGAGPVTVRAVGTSFAVSVLPERPVKVLVRHGLVQVNRTDEPLQVPVQASAGDEIVASPRFGFEKKKISSQVVANELAWKSGRISLEGVPLGEAAMQFSRYSDIEIDVDPEVKDKPVTGFFVTTDPIGFAKAAAAVLDLRTEVNGRKVHISAN